MKWLLSLLVALGLIGGGLSVWYLRASGHHGDAFRTAAVDRGTIATTISATGTIEPEEVVDVGAQVAGMIKNFGPDPRDSTRTIDYGSPVEQGTVLAQIDDSLYQAQVDQAKASLKKAEGDLIQMQAKLRQSDRDWNRAQTLGRTDGVISGLDYDTTRATYDTARSAVTVGQAVIDQARAALQQAEINLGYCTIRSPVKGVIIDRRVNVGQTVVSSLNAPSLFLIAKDLKRLQIWASVNEADIGQIHEGQPVAFTVDAYPDQVFHGAVTQIRLNATMTQNVVTYTVVVTTDNSDGKLLPYLTANLAFQVSEHRNVLRVPNAALRWRPQPEQVVPEARAAFTRSLQRTEKSAGDQAAVPTHHNRGVVWVEDHGFVRPVKVQTGLSDGVVTEIVGGELKDSDAVVVGAAASSDAGDSTSPFTPQLFGGKKAS
jgi:HlyD family secretion protein